MKVRRAAWLVLALPGMDLASAGCGYHTAGHAVQLPENVKTIAVPAFVNETSTYRIEQMLTSSVVREFTTRTHYHILNNPGEAADATLRGTVLSASSTPLTYNSATGQAASVLVVVSMKVSLTDRAGQGALPESFVSVSRAVRSFAGSDQLFRGRLARLPAALAGFCPYPGL